MRKLKTIQHSPARIQRTRRIGLAVLALLAACVSLPHLRSGSGLYTAADGSVLELHRSWDDAIRGYLISGGHPVALAPIDVRGRVIDAKATREDGSKSDVRIAITSNRELVVDEKRFLLTATQKPADAAVRREIEAAYSKLADAVDTRNYDAFQAIRVAGFATISPDGLPNSASKMAERARALLDRIQQPVTTTNDILDLKLRGDDAIATVHQKFTRNQTIGGTRHEVRTEVTQREIWTRTAEGWKLRFVDDVRDQVTLVDGKPRS